MLKSILAIAASRVIVDERTKQTTIVDVIEGIKSQGFPLVMPHVTFLFNLRRDESTPQIIDGHLSYRIESDEVGRFPVQIGFKGRLAARSIIEFEGFLVPRPGLLTVELRYEDKVVADLEIFVEKIETENPKVRQSSSEL